MPFLPLGGQAVIEGVMMRSPTQVAVAVRRPDGSLAYLERRFESITRRVKLLGLPVVRGAVSLFETLSLGITALNFSADEAARESGQATAEKPSAWMNALQYVVVAVSLALGALLFVVLPARLTGWLGFQDRWRFGLVDGGFRLLAFVGYLAASLFISTDIEPLYILMALCGVTLDIARRETGQPLPISFGLADAGAVVAMGLCGIAAVYTVVRVVGG